jgi:hypothetical protein
LATAMGCSAHPSRLDHALLADLHADGAPGGVLHLRLDRDQVGELLGSYPAAGLPGDSARARRSQDGLGLQGGEIPLRLTGEVQCVIPGVRGDQA